MVYHVIDKRKRELDDVAKGMEEVHLHSFLGRCGSDILDSIFPSSEKRRITFDEMKEITVFEETEGHEETITYWHNYLFQLSKYEPERPTLTDLCCFWTATSHLPPRKATLRVKFNEDDAKLPMAETCFCIMTLPTIHRSYDEFKKYMDIALMHGSMGIDLS